MLNKLKKKDQKQQGDNFMWLWSLIINQLIEFLVIKYFTDLNY